MASVNRLLWGFLVIGLILFSGCSLFKKDKDSEITPPPTPILPPGRCQEIGEFGYDLEVKNGLHLEKDGEKLPMIMDTCEGNILLEVSCIAPDSSEYKTERIDCEDKSCIDGKCVDTSCEDDCSWLGYVCRSGKCVPYSCKDSEDGANPEMPGTVKYDIIRTLEGGTYDLSGKYDVPFGEILNQKESIGQKDSCSTDKLGIYEYYCDNSGEIQYTMIACSSGTECLESYGVCGITDKDMDTIPDNLDKCVFGTSIGEAIYQKDESSDIYGCSCKDQIALNGYSSERKVSVSDGNEFIEVDCKMLEETTEECMIGGREFAPHCCNGVAEAYLPGLYPDDYEAMADCGGECEICDGSYCKQLTEGAKIDAIFIPVGYYPRYPEINTERWKKRAIWEAYNLITTPPFCESAAIESVLGSPSGTSFLPQAKCSAKPIDDPFSERFGELEIADETQFIPKMNIYRLDVFGIYPELDKHVKDVDSLLNYAYDATNLYYSKFCTDDEFKLFYYLPDMALSNPATYKYRSNYRNLVIYEFTGEIESERGRYNVISHETGHALCGLTDEYTVSGGDSDVESRSLNCDDSPDICDLDEAGEPINCREKSSSEICINSEGINRCICKWDSESSKHDDYITNAWKLYYPKSTGYDIGNAGCIEGCNQKSVGSWRPQFNEPGSMMHAVSFIDEDRTGPGIYGLGAWNMVGYVACKESVEMHSKE